jgi:hypothetical protein
MVYRSKSSGLASRSTGCCPIHQAQLLTYMGLTELLSGLLANFRETVLKNGLRRLNLHSNSLSLRLPVTFTPPTGASG